MLTRVNPAQQRRIQRSFLAVPGATPELFPKAARSGADQVFLDLEDAVAWDDKEAARRPVIEGLHNVDWKGQGQTISVRVNAPDSPFMEADIREMVSAAGPTLDTLLVPKVASAEDIVRVDRLMTEAEAEVGRSEPIGLEVLIETASGFLNVAEIAGVSNRLEALHFGAGDFAASMGARTTEIGQLDPVMVGDQWLPVRIGIVAAARANGLRPIDSAYGDFRDVDGYRASAQRAAAIGFEGKWAIHPSQVPIANEVFSPTTDEVANALQILAAMESAAAEGKGAAQINGVMIDAATTGLARNIVAIAERLS